MQKKENKKPEDKIIECCDAELTRETFKQSNCEIAYASELKHMMDLYSGLARTIFSGVLKTNNLVIVETTTLSNVCPLMDLFMHLGFDINGIRTYGINLIYKRF